MGSQLNLSGLKDYASVTTHFCSEKEMKIKHRGKDMGFFSFYKLWEPLHSSRENGV